jgi:hypothetical protein
MSVAVGAVTLCDHHHDRLRQRSHDSGVCTRGGTYPPPHMAHIYPPLLMSGTRQQCLHVGQFAVYICIRIIIYIYIYIYIYVLSIHTHTQHTHIHTGVFVGPRESWAGTHSVSSKERVSVVKCCVRSHGFRGAAAGTHSYDK